MGPELLAAVLGPVVSAMISFIVWYGKKTTDKMDLGFKQVSNQIELVEKSVDELKLDVAKHYVTKKELLDHMKSEEARMDRTNDHLTLITAKLDKITEQGLQNEFRINNILSNQTAIVERYNEKLETMQDTIDENTDFSKRAEKDIHEIRHEQFKTSTELDQLKRRLDEELQS